MAYLIGFLLLAGVVWFISDPLRRRRPGAGSEDDRTVRLQRIDLEAARDAKYREIRDAELDHQTGKLSDDDYQAVDAELRAEAVQLLHELDALGE